MTIFNWRSDFPENSELIPSNTFSADFIRVLVTGRYQKDGHLHVDIVNRMRRKNTGIYELDTSDSLGVPLDGKWHWQTSMIEVVAWSLLPDKNDSRWIPCSQKLPEDIEAVHSCGRMKLLSVMGLSTTFGNNPEVKLINRLSVEPTGSPYLDEQATDGWVWSKNAGDVKAWMPFPEPAQDGYRQKATVSL